MLYLIAFLCPPLAVLLCGRPILAAIALFLTCLYFPAVLLALLVVSAHYADRRSDRLVAQLHRGQVAVARQNRAIFEAADRQARALELQSELMARALEARRPADPQLPPPPEPIDVTPAEALPGLIPRRPIGEILAEWIARARYAYDSLPEWGQPVLWGLAAATPVVLLLAAYQALR